MKTLDSGSQRLEKYLFQLTYSNTTLSTTKELFDFAECIDTEHEFSFSFEFKISADCINSTR